MPAETPIFQCRSYMIYLNGYFFPFMCVAHCCDGWWQKTSTPAKMILLHYLTVELAYSVRASHKFPYWMYWSGWLNFIQAAARVSRINHWNGRIFEWKCSQLTVKLIERIIEKKRKMKIRHQDKTSPCAGWINWDCIVSNTLEIYVMHKYTDNGLLEIFHALSGYSV